MEITANQINNALYYHTKRVFDFPYRREFFRGCVWALLLAVLLFGVRALITYEDGTSLYLSLTLRSPQEGVSALYYDVGKGYNDGHVWGTDAFNTIQAGIDAVDPGGTVNVAAAAKSGTLSQYRSTLS